MKSDLVRLRLTPEKKQSWFEAANRQGLTISAFIERCVEEAIQLSRALELEVEDRRRAQEARRRAGLEESSLPTS